jgi:hypothetical protein
MQDRRLEFVDEFEETIGCPLCDAIDADAPRQVGLDPSIADPVDLVEERRAVATREPRASHHPRVQPGIDLTPGDLLGPNRVPGGSLWQRIRQKVEDATGDAWCGRTGRPSPPRRTPGGIEERELCTHSLRPGTQLTIVGPPGQRFVEPSCGLGVATHPVIDLVEQDRVATRVIEDLPVPGDQVIRQPQLAHEDRDLGEPCGRGRGCRGREA